MPMLVKALESVKERSTAWLTVAFFDENGDAVSPASITYRVDDVSSGASLRDTTSVAPAATIEIKLNAEDNRILNQANAVEMRAVTLRAAFGLDDECNDVAVYQVENLTFLS